MYKKRGRGDRRKEEEEGEENDTRRKAMTHVQGHT